MPIGVESLAVAPKTAAHLDVNRGGLRCVNAYGPSGGGNTDPTSTGTLMLNGPIVTGR